MRLFRDDHEHSGACSCGSQRLKAGGTRHRSLGGVEVEVGVGVGEWPPHGGREQVWALAMAGEADPILGQPSPAQPALSERKDGKVKSANKDIVREREGGREAT